MPGPQFKHVDDVEAPVELEYFPAAQREHVLSAMAPTVKSGEGAQGYAAVAIASALTPYTCICKEGGKCRALSGFDSYLVRLKRCRSFDPGARRHR